MTTAGPKPEEQAEVDALAALALRQQSAGRLAEAAAAYRKILLLRPDSAGACNNLGNVLTAQGNVNEALACFEQTIALKPDHAEAHYNLGCIFRTRGKLDEAAAQFERSLAHRPDLAVAHNNLGCIFAEQGKLERARAQFEQVLAMRPDHVEAYNNLGSILWKQDKLDEAAARLAQSLALRPDYAEAHNNLGNVLLSQNKLDEAAASYGQALKLRPNYAEAHSNLGNVRQYQGKFDEAMARFEQALALKPEYADAQLGLATCYLVNGDYERGWPAWEARLRLPGRVPQTSLRRWMGEPLAGRSLLLLTEQGLGDTIQFVRYARLLKAQGARVVLAAQAALGRLLASYADVDELFLLGSGEELPQCDFYLPLQSAPGALRTDAQAIPGETPYLAADRELTARWRRELATIEGFKIGIAWQGARDFVSDRSRSMPLAHFAPLARLRGVHLISLQKGFGSEQIGGVDFPVLDLSDRLDQTAGPFMDTAAVISSVDLVVTSDTAIPHLAGALAAPVWVALRFSPDWRFLLEREDSPWYPTMRLFRQRAPGAWPEVFERIAQAVEERRSELKLEETPH